MKLLKHSRDKTGDFQERVLLHIPAGLIIGIPVLGWAFAYIFKAYEENEDAHTRDQAWKDYFGALVGAVIMTLLCTGALIWLITGLIS